MASKEYTTFDPSSFTIEMPEPLSPCLAKIQSDQKVKLKFSRHSMFANNAL